MFKLEMIFAFEGDCLLLHYGDSDQPEWILIDGGARTTWRDRLKPRLARMAQQLGEPVPLRMVMVSHVDSDHIKGVLDMYKLLKDDHAEQICTVDVLWHNSFDDIIDNDDEELVSALITPPDGEEIEDRDVAAVVEPASINQGRNLRLDAEALATEVNTPFTGLVRALDGPPVPIDQGFGLTFEVLAPGETRLQAFQKKWRDFLVDKQLAQVRTASFDDTSPANLSSIVVLAKRNGKSMLLTGDARGDDIVNGLVGARLLREDAAYPIREDFPAGRSGTRQWKEKLRQADTVDPVSSFGVDLLKMPHHGSDRNVMTGFFRRVLADHYVISADGNHGNPDVPTLRMIAEARGDAPYTLYFSFTADQHQHEDNQEFAEALEKVHDWVRDEKPAGCTVIHRASANVASLSIDLDG
ncbi:MAG: hypothetical protein V3T72_18510 [Thermoanaerobaculia bacterium]